MTAPARARLALVLAVATTLLAAGCERAGARGESQAARSPGAACEELATRLCDVAGRETPSCAELASALRLLPEAACGAGLAEIDVPIERLRARAARCPQLVERLCADLGSDTTACQRVRADAPGLPPDRCELMLAHYEATLVSIQEQAAADRPLDAAALRELAAGAPPGFGPGDARVTLVSFVDFECPFCARAAPVVARIREVYGDRIRFIVRHFPLEAHPHARLAAEASLEAHAQGRFWELHDRLYAGQAALDRAALEKLGAEAGLDMDALRTALADGRHRAAVEHDVALGEGVAVDGTPTLFVNGARVENPADFTEVARLVDAALGG